MHNPSTQGALFGFITMCFSVAQGIVTGCNAVVASGNSYIPTNFQCDATTTGSIAIAFALAGVFSYIIAHVFTATNRDDGYSVATPASAIFVMTALSSVSLSELITESCDQALLHGGCAAWNYWGGATFMWAFAATMGALAVLVNHCRKTA